MQKQMLGEFLGTLILILLGNGVVASVLLHKSKAEGAGWMVITTGWAFAVMAGVFTAVACGAPGHLNPAVTLASAITSGDFSIVGPYWIAQLLGAEGYKSSTGKLLTESMIQWVRHKHRIPPPGLPANTFSVGQLCEQYGVSKGVVYYWIDRGVIAAEQRKHNAPYAITIDGESDRRLREWVTQSAHLPPSSQTQTVQGAL